MEDSTKTTQERELLIEAFKEIFRNSDDYSFVKDLDLVYHAASEKFVCMTGRSTAADVLGKTDFDLFPQDIAEAYRSDDQYMFQTGQPIEGIVERLPEQDGRARWSKTWKHIVRNSAGQPIGMYGIGRDVSYEKGLESEIAASRRARDLIQNIPGGVGILHEQDGNYILDFVNEGWCQAHHISQAYGQTLVGTNVQDFVYEEDLPQVQAEFQRVNADPQAQGDTTYRVFSENGELHWINISYRRAYVERGVQYYYAAYMDMDKQKRIEERLAESQQALREAVSHSDIQFFTYFPNRHRCEIYAVNTRLCELPTVWENFPDDFLQYTQASPEDAQAYRDMLKQIEQGADMAECTACFAYEGKWTYEKLHINAVRDAAGRVIKGQGYSQNITKQKVAEERLREKMLRVRSLSGNNFETFTFNVTKGNGHTLNTTDPDFVETPVLPELWQEALQLCPGLRHVQEDACRIILQAAARIPNKGERRNFLRFCDPDIIREEMETGRSRARIRYRRYKGKTIRWLESCTEILPDPGTTDLIAFYYTSDITDRVVQEKLFAQILHKRFEMVAYLDLQTQMLYMQNPDDVMDASFTEGLPYEKVVEAMLRDNVVPEEEDSFRKHVSLDQLMEQLTAKPVYTFYYTGRNSEGRLLRKMQSDAFYLDEYKDHIVFLIMDVTGVFEQEMEHREKMSAALVAAEQASVAKTEFLSRMSHEIRTPMNAIIGLDAIALQEQGLSRAMVDHLQKIGISARFLLSLINDILDMSRIESGRMLLKNESFDFEELIDGINTILYEQCRENELDYDCVLKSFTESTYIGDATKLQQVLVNILGNAVKFTSRGGKIHFMIEQLSRTREKARLRFEIADTGIGISEDFLPELFKPFSQENPGRTSAYGGTGLGLAISQNIVNLMGGEITVHSIKNVGTEFTIEVELGLTEEAMARRALYPQAIKPLFTLIVDDDVIVCRHAQIVLHEAGLKTEWVESGAAAVDKVVAQHEIQQDYDLILLDWMMPDMDGIETARQIRRIVGPDVTIIIMTAFDWASIETKARAAGVDMFMKKPVFANQVQKAFEDVLLHKNNVSPVRKTYNYDFSGRRVLLAEDNEINAEIAKSLLEMKNCVVEVANNGAEAVESFASVPVGYYDAILMDVRMPVMDGLEATRTIRAMRKSSSKIIPIIAMTANAFQEDVNRSLESGMNAHLAKPIEPELLYGTLEKYFLKES